MQSRDYKDRAFAQKGMSFAFRIRLFAGSFVACVALVMLYHVSIVLNAEPNQPNKQAGKPEGVEVQFADPCGIYGDEKRGNIFDRNGELLATTRVSYNLSIRSSELPFATAQAIAERLKRMIRGIDKNKVVNVLRSAGNGGVIKTRALMEDIALIQGLPPDDELRTLVFWDEKEPLQSRYYPKGALTSQVIGGVTLPVSGHQLTSHSPKLDDQKRYYYKTHQLYGISGIEKGSDCALREGKNVQTTLDLRLQYILRESLLSQLTHFRAKQAGGVLLDIANGDILALISLPDFDPNNTRYDGYQDLPNMMVAQRFEMGSVFKVINFAIAFESKSVNFHRRFDIGRPLRTASGFIRDYRPKKKVLSLEEVFTHSSNIGSAKIARGVDLSFYWEQLLKLGAFSAPNVSGFVANAVVEPRHSMERSISKNERDYISHGYGLEIAPLHLAAIVAAIVNDGKRVGVRLLLDEGDEHETEKVLSSVASRAVRHLLYRNVLDGTAKGARVDGFFLGGKTGSSNKLSVRQEGGKRHYFYDADNRLASFVGVFPIEEPRYVLLVSFDEPQPVRAGGFATGGVVAAPVVKEVVSRSFHLLDIEKQVNARATADLLSIPKDLR